VDNYNCPAPQKKLFKSGSLLCVVALARPFIISTAFPHFIYSISTFYPRTGIFRYHTHSHFPISTRKHHSHFSITTRKQHLHFPIAIQNHQKFPKNFSKNFSLLAAKKNFWQPKIFPFRFRFLFKFKFPKNFFVLLFGFFHNYMADIEI